MCCVRATTRRMGSVQAAMRASGSCWWMVNAKNDE